MAILSFKTVVTTDGQSVTTSYNKSHGSPFDRGGADFYYHRPPEPHYWASGTGHGIKTTEEQMTNAEIAEYNAGFAEAADYGDQKDWG